MNFESNIKGTALWFSPTDGKIGFYPKHVLHVKHGPKYWACGSWMAAFWLRSMSPLVLSYLYLFMNYFFPVGQLVLWPELPKDLSEIQIFCLVFGLHYWAVKTFKALALKEMCIFAGNVSILWKFTC